MKIKSLLLTALLALLCVGLLPQQASARVTFSYFYDSLQPYGDWVDVDNYGYCWQPRGLDPDWRPYTDGYWAYTDAGWTWVSYEDFGSITYHYGRWVRLEDFGWVWKPDYQWGPAWVSWRQSDDYIGWAPLPPEVDFNPDSGIGVWVDRDYDIGPSAYSFCEYRYFGAPVLRNVILPRRQNLVIINSTVNITNITFITGNDRGRVVFNSGPDYRRMSERTEHRIEMLQLMRQTDGDWARHPRPEFSRRVGGQLFINAPEIEAPQKRFAPSRVAREIRAPKIDKGWAGIADNRDRERIQQRYQDQTRGLTRATAPAYKVDQQAVQTMLNESRAAEFNTKAARAQQKLQIEQQKATVEQQSRAAKFNAKAARAQQKLQVQQPQVQQSQVQQPQVQQPQVQQPQVQQQQVQQQQVQQQQVQQPQVQQPRRGARDKQEKAQPQQDPAEQQRRAAESNARATRAQQENAQRDQQAQQQQQAAEQQRRAAESNARAARAQQEKAQRDQQVQQQQQAAEQQRRAAESNARAARAPQAPQPSAERRERAPKEAQSSPTPDDNDPRKKHRN